MLREILNDERSSMNSTYSVARRMLNDRGWKFSTIMFQQFLLRSLNVILLQRCWPLGPLFLILYNVLGGREKQISCNFNFCFWLKKCCEFQESLRIVEVDVWISFEGYCFLVFRYIKAVQMEAPGFAKKYSATNCMLKAALASVRWHIKFRYKYVQSYAPLL